MRRLTTVLLLLLIAVSAAFCDVGDISSATSTFDFSAYKNPELPSLRYTITVSNNVDDSIIGTTKEYRINYNQTLNNALTVTISTNLKNDIAVELWFYPFINEYDSYDIFTATYTTSTSNMSSAYVNCEYNSTQYRYKGNWQLSGFPKNGENTYTITPLTGSGIRGTITSKITCDKYTNGSWKSNNNIPNQNGVILGFTEDQFVVNTITFSMKPNLGNRTPEPNMKYVAKVRLVISTV